MKLSIYAIVGCSDIIPVWCKELDACSPRGGRVELVDLKPSPYVFH
jgi:hypothetical protein